MICFYLCSKQTTFENIAEKDESICREKNVTFSKVYHTTVLKLPNDRSSIMFLDVLKVDNSKYIYIIKKLQKSIITSSSHWLLFSKRIVHTLNQNLDLNNKD